MAPMEDAIATVDTPPAPEPVASATFEDFFHQQHRGLFGALWLLTRDRSEAEELMQDAFLKVLERWDRIRDLDDSVGYLYRTAMNLFRSRRRRVAMAMRRVVRPQPQEDGLADVEEREAVARALAPLTPRGRGPGGCPRAHLRGGGRGARDQGLHGSGARCPRTGRAEKGDERWMS
jgi:hypothetical protein